MTRLTVPSGGRNRHPADELADIRAEIRRLKAREDRLRQAMLDDPSATRGCEHRVTVQTQKRRVFLRDRLPADILGRDDLWETRLSQVVKVEPLSRTTARPTQRTPHRALEDADDFDVIEPF